MELDENTTNRLKNVRKNIWIGGGTGFLCGSIVGFIGHKFYTNYNTVKVNATLKAKGNTKNTLIAFVLVSASFFSFLGALVEGKNSAQYIGDVFRIGSSPRSSYRKVMVDNEKEIIQNLDESFLNRKIAIENSKKK
jgi:hypothetical protein